MGFLLSGKVLWPILGLCWVVGGTEALVFPGIHIVSLTAIHYLICVIVYITILTPDRVSTSQRLVRI